MTLDLSISEYLAGILLEEYQPKKVRVFVHERDDGDTLDVQLGMEHEFGWKVEGTIGITHVHDAPRDMLGARVLDYAEILIENMRYES